MGTVFAVLAVIFTSLAQIFTSSNQKELGCDALQLLYHTAPLIASGMFVMVPMLDDYQGLLNYEPNMAVITHIIISCVLALGVNISNYLVLGKTSPLTYQVLGHLKTIMILVLGFVVFHYESNQRVILGIVVALVGVIAYTEIKRRNALTPLNTVKYAPVDVLNEDEEVGLKEVELRDSPMKSKLSDSS